MRVSEDGLGSLTSMVDEELGHRRADGRGGLAKQTVVGGCDAEIAPSCFAAWYEPYAGAVAAWARAARCSSAAGGAGVTDDRQLIGRLRRP